MSETPKPLPPLRTRLKREGDHWVNDRGDRVCGARRKLCRECQRRFLGRAKSCEAEGCGYRFGSDTMPNCLKCGAERRMGEYELWQCPDCGYDRKCENFHIGKNFRCRMHSRNSLPGLAHPSYKTGRYTKVYKKLGLEEQHQAALLANLRDSHDALASMQTRIFALMENGEGVELFGKVAQAWKDFTDAWASKDKAKIDDTAAKMDGLVGKGRDEVKRWNEVFALEERMDRIRYRAHKMEVESEMLIRTDYALMIMDSFMYAVKEKITKTLESHGLYAESHHVIAELGDDLDRILRSSGTKSLATGH